MPITNAGCADLAQAMHPYVEAIPAYGGMRILDNAAVEVSVADDDPATLERFRRVYRDQDNPLQIPLVLRPVEYSYQQLLDAMARVDEARDLVAPFGAYISVMGPSVEMNRLRISLSRYTAAAADALYAEFGQIIFVDTEGCTVAPA